jgi:hypothetical protein
LKKILIQIKLNKVILHKITIKIIYKEAKVEKIYLIHQDLLMYILSHPGFLHLKINLNKSLIRIKLILKI